MNSPLLWGSARAHTNIPWLFWRKFTLFGFKRLSLVFLVLALALSFWAKSSESGWQQDSLPGCDGLDMCVMTMMMLIIHRWSSHTLQISTQQASQCPEPGEEWEQGSESVPLEEEGLLDLLKNIYLYHKISINIILSFFISRSWHLESFWFDEKEKKRVLFKKREKEKSSFQCAKT